MFWNDEKQSKNEFVVPDDIIDIAYKLECKTLPLDHAHALSQALIDALPWLAKEDAAGIHLIHVAESGNGWYRPDDPENEVLHLSRRTRMTLRIPKDRIEDAHKLSGKTLLIDGCELTVKEGAIKKLSALPTLFARYVMSDADEDEHTFLQNMAEQLHALEINVQKMMAGKQTRFRLPNHEYVTRSLMVADLDPEQSVKLQQIVSGPGRKQGCGLFLPQKGIKPVKPDGE